MSTDSSAPTPPMQDRQTFNQAVAELRTKASTQPKEAAKELSRLVDIELDYSSAMALAKILGRFPLQAKPTCRLAILAGFTTTQLAGLLRLFLFAKGVTCEIYESEFDVFRQEILNPDSGLHEFRPDVVFLATDRNNLGHAPSPDDSADRVKELVAAEVAEWGALWRTVHERLGCRIVQNNFEPPPWRTLDNHERRHHAGLGRFIALLNQALLDQAPNSVVIHDVDHLSATAGRWAWGDPRFYFQAKLPCAPEFLVGYAHQVASIIAAQLGKVKKCLVLDLDNTLWGGVIGDDGVDGIRLGHGMPEGEAFSAFQQYVDRLRRRGVILAVCSKNNDDVARQGFSHPDMVLKLEHIACFVANWQDKASNLRHIAQTLEIGLDSLVFADDNPAERELVRRYAPEVSVPELPVDPAGYIQAIDQHAYFQTVAVGTEDLQRTVMYQAQNQRKDAESKAGNIDDFLASLNMVAKLEVVHAGNAERVAQLLARSNQFNLTTRRHSAAAVLAMAADPAQVTCAVSLRDRFGDNGLISVLLAKQVGGDMLIDSWIMSCRVLKRGVEQFLLNHLCAVARERGAEAVIGDYIPTPKNALVAGHFPTFGFKPLPPIADGQTRWTLTLADAPARPTFITKEHP